LEDEMGYYEVDHLWGSIKSRLMMAMIGVAAGYYLGYKDMKTDPNGFVPSILEKIVRFEKMDSKGNATPYCISTEVLENMPYIVVPDQKPKK
jgi:hypothetical protein